MITTEATTPARRRHRLIRRKNRGRLLASLGIAASLALVAAACGGDDDTETTPTTQPAATTTAAPAPAAPDYMGDGSLGEVRVSAGEAIQVRSLNAITGDVAFLGLPMQRGIEMAIDDFGPIQGFDVDMGTGLDDLCSADGGQAAAQTIAADDYEATFTLDGPGTLAMQYLLTDAASGEIIQQGEAEPLDNNQFAVKLNAATTTQLDLGLYELILVAYSDELARMAERRIPLETDIALIAEDTEEPSAQTDSPQATADKDAENTQPVSDAEPQPIAETEPSAEVESAPSPQPVGGLPVNLIVIVGLFAVLILGGAFWFVRR